MDRWDSFSFSSSTSHSEPYCKGTYKQRSAANSQAHNLHEQQVNTQHLLYKEREHGRRKHLCPRKYRQPEVSLTEQKLLKLLDAQGKAQASEQKQQGKVQGMGYLSSSAVGNQLQSRAVLQIMHAVNIS